MFTSISFTRYKPYYEIVTTFLLYTSCLSAFKLKIESIDSKSRYSFHFFQINFEVKLSKISSFEFNQSHNNLIY